MSIKLLHGISQLVQPHADEGETKAPVTVTENAALLIDAHTGVIIAAGAFEQIRADHPQCQHAQKIDLGGRAVAPGLVDSHTHTVFAGDRIGDMARRARGESYEDIARAGGGIASTVTHTQKATQQQLVDGAQSRLQRMLARGTTTCEIKSGYGITPAAELTQLAAIQQLTHHTPMQIVSTVLAHMIPKEMRVNPPTRDAYVQQFCTEIVPHAAQQYGARYCDVFVDQHAFTQQETRQIASAAQRAGLAIKLHVDQLRDEQGAALAAELRALSADHLEYTGTPGFAKLAQAGVVATMLPGCGLFLGKGPWPDGRAMRDAGCEVAIATDYNPGSSHIADLTLCGTMAMTRGGLTIEEALWGITRGGAKALGLLDRGCLRAGERADAVVIDHTDWRALLYSPGMPPIDGVMIGGATLPLSATC